MGPLNALLLEMSKPSAKVALRLLQCRGANEPQNWDPPPHVDTISVVSPREGRIRLFFKTQMK